VATVRRQGQLPDVIEGLRNGLPAAAAERLAVRLLDLLLPETVEAVVSEIEVDGGPDVLVNNAGYGLIGGVEQTTIDQARAHLETNFLATMALVQRVLPGMRARRAGHVVNVSSVFVPGLCPPAVGWYVASKAALETAAQAMAVELAPFGIRVTNFQPGPISTELSRVWGDRLAAGVDPRPGLVDELYAWVGSDAAPAMQTPEMVGRALVDLLESDHSPLAAQSGAQSEGYVAAAVRDPSRERELQAMLQRFAEIGRPG
jgi:NAD(P)-dependent dehydrogenase (short-subunit alcohol dehydrogenase family)